VKYIPFNNETCHHNDSIIIIINKILMFTVWPLKLKNILIWPTTYVNYTFTVVSLGLWTLKSNTNTNTERSFSETKPPETEREEEALISASYYSLWFDPLFCFFSLISLFFCCIFLYSTHKWREFIGVVIAPVILTAGNDPPFLINHFSVSIGFSCI